MTTPVPGTAGSARTVPVGALLNAATFTVTVAVRRWPLSPSRPKVSMLSSPASPWMWNPLSASLAVTAKESMKPECACG